MKYCLVMLLATVAVAAAAPGMRGNGASGATRDIDPENPNIRSQRSTAAAANAVATGVKPSAFTYTAERPGQRYSSAVASSMGGSSVASARA